MNTRNHNILIDELPETISINNNEYPINTSFRVGIMFSQLLDEVKDPAEFQLYALRLYFDEKYKRELLNKQDTIKEIVWFFNCGFREDERKLKYIQENNIVLPPSERYYDYDYDADSIYASFIYDYGIDLQDIENLHWWKFNAMLRGLSDETRFKKILHIRTYDMTELSPKAKSRIQKIQSQEPYKIPVREEANY